MSFSNPDADIKNPAVRFFQWKGGKGEIEYYDKEAKESVTVPMPFTFIVLDQLNTVSGFSDEAQSSYYSNEVRNSILQPFVVRLGKAIAATGLWTDIKKSGLQGVKFAKSVYIAFKDESGEFVIGNLKLLGSSLNWFDFCKNNNLYDIAVSIADKEKAKKGSNEYFTPVFKANPLTDESRTKAKELDETLQHYLGVYFSRSASPADEMAQAEYVPTYKNPISDNPEDWADAERQAIESESEDDSDGTPF